MTVWEVTPHPGTTRFDCYVDKDWAAMLRYVADNLDALLERHEPGQLAEGVTITIREVEMSEEEYAEIEEAAT
jgi:hypothetical protein